MKRFSCMILALVLGISALAGCGSSEEKSVPEGTVRVLFASSIVNQEAAEEYAASMAARSELIQEVRCETLSMGSSTADPTMYMTAAMKLTGWVAANEIDVIIYDKNEAARDARGDTFYAMSDLFSQEELDKMEGRLISYHQVDTEGNETDEMTPECGLDLSGDAELAQVLNTEEIGIYVVGNAQNLEAVKALIMSYAEQ